MEFKGFPKMARLSREIIVTEKIDGTNAQVFITDDGDVMAGSRTRWIYPGDDNFGFAAWVQEHRDELLTLGPGQHFGEWWGARHPARLWRARQALQLVQRDAMGAARYRATDVPNRRPASDADTGCAATVLRTGATAVQGAVRHGARRLYDRATHDRGQPGSAGLHEARGCGCLPYCGRRRVQEDTGQRRQAEVNSEE